MSSARNTLWRCTKCREQVIGPNPDGTPLDTERVQHFGCEGSTIIPWPRDDDGEPILPRIIVSI